MAVLEEITIRHDFRPGDIGTMVYMHGSLYQVEFGYGIPFETYVLRRHLHGAVAGARACGKNHRAAAAKQRSRVSGGGAQKKRP